MYYVGVDVGYRRSSVEILGEEGKTFKRWEVRGGYAAVIEEVARKTPQPYKVCFEASCGYGFLYEGFSRSAAQVVVAHPGQLRLIFRAKKKHNRVDASKIAKLLYLDEVPAVHVPRADVRTWRAMIEYRQRVMRRRVAVKNQIRALLRGLGTAPIRSLWSRAGQAKLRAVPMGEADALRREMMLEELGQLNERIKQVEQHLAKEAQKHPGVALLRTIPGVGIRTAEAVVAYLDDVRRFTRINQVGSYLGLVPCEDSTGDQNRLGHITRDGPATVRKLLTEASWAGIRHSATIRGFFERVMHEDPDRRKQALVATAHYLARVMAAMLRTGEVWREREVPRGVAAEGEAKVQRPAEAGGAATAVLVAATAEESTAKCFSPPGRGRGAKR